MNKLSLSDQDIDDIARMVETEVGLEYHKRDPVEYSKMVGAVVDTVTNRVASPNFPNSVRGVVNQRNQFSKISGLPSAYGSVQKAPKAKTITRETVEQHLAERSMGKPSLIGGALNYANVQAVDKKNKDPNSWSQRMAREDTTVKLGIPGMGFHNHGNAPKAVSAPEYSVSVPKEVANRAAFGGAMQRYNATYPSNLAYSKAPASLPDIGPVPTNPADARAIAHARTRMPTNAATRVANLPASAPRLASPIANAFASPQRPANAAAAIDRMLANPQAPVSRTPMTAAAYSATPAAARVSTAPVRAAAVPARQASPVAPTRAAVQSAPRPANSTPARTTIRGVDVTPAAPTRMAAATLSPAQDANLASRLNTATPMASIGPRVAPTSNLSAAQTANLASRLAGPTVASVANAPQRLSPVSAATPRQAPSAFSSALSTIGNAIAPAAQAATLPSAVRANVPTLSRPANVQTSPVATNVVNRAVSAAVPNNPTKIASREISPMSYGPQMQAAPDPARFGAMQPMNLSPVHTQRAITPSTAQRMAERQQAAPMTLASLPAPREVTTPKVAGVPVAIERETMVNPARFAPNVPARQIAPDRVQRLTTPAMATRLASRPAPAVTPATAYAQAPAVTPARAVVQNAIASAPRLGAPSIPNAPAQPGMLGRIGGFFSNNAPRAIGAVVGGAVLGPVGGILGGYLGNRLGNGPAMSNAARAAMDAGTFDGFGYGPSRSPAGVSSGGRGGGNVGGLGGLGGMSSGPTTGVGGNGSNYSGSSFGGGRNATGGNNNTSSSSKSSGSKSSGGKKK